MAYHDANFPPYNELYFMGESVHSTYLMSSYLHFVIMNDEINEIVILGIAGKKTE